MRALIASLEVKSDDPVCASAPEAIDLAVLKLIAEDPAVAAARGGPRAPAVGGLRAARLPQGRRRCTMRAWSAACTIISREGGHVPHEWFAAEVTRLDNVNGDIEALADRLAGIRSWAYIAHRSDWLADPPKWAERTREVESRLSDALHGR